MEMNSKLTALYEFVDLKINLQHAGNQFRAAQYVADNSETTRFIRPADWSDYPEDEELDETRWENLPWNGMHFMIENNPYTVVYMSHPSNPDNSQMSERKYVRFGECMLYQLAEAGRFEVP